MIDAVRKLMSGSGLRAQLLRGGMGSMAVKVTHALLAFFLAVVLARTLGPEGYGVYAFALAVLMLAAIPAKAGMPVLVVRETARAQSNENWALMRGLWRWATRWVLLFSLIVMGVVAAVLFGVTGLEHPRAATLAAGLFLIPLLALANIRGAALRGLRRVVQGQFPESVFRPALLLMAVLAVVFVVGRPDALTPERVMGLYVAAALAAFVLGAWMLFRSRPAGVKAAPKPEYKNALWRHSVLPLALIAGLQIINQQTDIVVLAIFREDTEVGIYRAAYQLAMLAVFGLQAMNMVVQPHFARLYEQDEMMRLQKLVTTSARVILLIALPVVLVLLFLGEHVIALVFGEPYREGAFALGVLASAQLVNASMGSVGPLLNMSGYERDTARAVGAAASGNLVLNFILVPMYGMAGAAVSTALTLVMWNLLLRYYVKKRLGLEVFAIGIRVNPYPR